MKRQEIIKTLIELFDEYLKDTIKERTHEFIENGENKKVLFKGDLEGFMTYLKNKELIEESVKKEIKTKEESNLETKKEEAQNIQKIFEAYSEKILPGSRLTANAKNKISTRLKEFSLEEIMQGIENFSKDSWWMENNAKRGISWFFYSEDRTEQFKMLSPRHKENTDKLKFGSYHKDIHPGSN
jgi:hypothetical protein